MRHLKRHHSDEDEVRKIFRLPKNSKERRQAFALLRMRQILIYLFKEKRDLTECVLKKMFQQNFCIHHAPTAKDCI
jgi:plasmid stability protein